MPTYEADLSDGRTVEFESDHEPTQEEILAAVQNYTPPAPIDDKEKRREALQAEMKDARLERIGGDIGEKVFSGAAKVLEPLSPSGVFNQPARIHRAITGETYPDPFQPGKAAIKEIPEPKGTNVVAGLGKFGARTGNMLQSPESLMTLPFAGPSALLRALFAGDMAIHLPETVKQSAEVLGDIESTPADRVVATLTPPSTAFMAGLLLKSNVKPFKEPPVSGASLKMPEGARPKSVEPETIKETVPPAEEGAPTPGTAPVSETMAEAASPASAPSAEVKVAEKPLETSVSQPEPAQMGLVPQVGPLVRGIGEAAGAALRYYSEPLVDRLATEGGPTAKGFSTMAKQMAQRSKELYGSITGTLDPALEATGKMSKATTWLNDIAPTSNRWGYRNAVDAVENPSAVIPPEAVDAVNKIKASNLEIGKLAQPVVPGFVASGKYQRNPTAFLVDTIRSGQGPAFDLLTQALSSENKIPSAKVQAILKDIKAEFDSPGSQQTIHKIAQEFQRHFPKFPTDLKIKTGFGDVWMPILHAKPFDYLSQAANATAQRVAFMERVPSGTLGPLRQSVVSELKNPAAFDDLVRALHGLPVNQPLNIFAPGSNAGMLLSGANRVLSDVFSPLKLTVSAIYNIPETVFGNTQAFYGWRNFAQGATSLPARHAALENIGAINRAIYNNSFDPKAPLRSLMGNFRNGLRKATAQQFFNELQEKLAASTAQVFAERAQGKSLSPGEISNFVDAAKAMGFERPAAESMAKGLGTPDQYNDFVRRSSSFTTGGNIQPAEASRFANNRIVSSLFRFQSYPQMKLNAFRKAYENMADAVESGDGARIKSSSEQLAKFLFGTAALGVSAKFLAALLTGRDGGVAGVAEDAEDGPGRFILDSVAGGMGGPVSALNYAVGSGNMLDTLDPRKLNAGITFPGSIYLELQQMFRLQGPYKGMTIGEAVGHYLKTKVPAGRVIRNALLATGVVTEPDQNTRETYRMANKFREKSTDPKIKAEFERSQKEHFEPSDYIALRVALQNDDLDRAKAEYQNLLKIKKHKDIMEAMNPKTQDGDWKPITGMSRKNELAFLITLSPKERSVFDAARQERMKTYRKFKESLAAP